MGEGKIQGGPPNGPPSFFELSAHNLPASTLRYGTIRHPWMPQAPAARARELAIGRDALGETGSIIIVVATDAALLPHQLKRIARRASLGLARTGSLSSNGSGDIFIAFSTANPGAGQAPATAQVTMLSNERIGAVFEATVQATEEAIINALVGAETMTGANGQRFEEISHDALRQVLRKDNRLTR